MNKGYDNAAFFYDGLSRLVFGDQLVQAQTAFLHYIPKDARVLIVGGGSGWILEKMAEALPDAKLSITYVEASAKMIALAQKRITKSPSLEQAPFFMHLITMPIEQAVLDDSYDVIITSFFFDNFRQEAAAQIFTRLDGVLKQNGLWLYTDFINSRKADHRLLLSSMFLFFGVLCGVKTCQLPDMDQLFARYKLKANKVFKQGFIKSYAFIKSAT